jgi:nucleoid DNA-binding protein
MTTSKTTKAVKPTKTVKPKTAAVKKTGPKPLSKGELYRILAVNTGIDKKAIAVVMDELASLIYSAVAKGGVGKFTLPGVLKVVTKATPARPEREGINRFTGEKAVFKAKPASVKVKILPVKALKEAAVQ